MGNDIIDSIKSLNKDAIIKILQYSDEKQQQLFSIAREMRNNGKFGKKVELRSVIELSNICSQKCNYCSISKDKDSFYTLEKESVIERISRLADIGRKTFLLQSGENNNKKFIENVAYCCNKSIEKYPDLRIILCMGNLSYAQYKLLRESGASRYILKFETSNSEHHKFCRPTDSIENRLNHIKMLIDLGFKVGSGNIVGLPEQTFENLYEDLVLINKIDLSMVSATRFISNPQSVFRIYENGDLNLTLNYLAILRILKPDALIPSTTSLASPGVNGQLNGLLAGCNTVTIHDGTPDEFQQKYSIYSPKRFSPNEQYCRDIVTQCNLQPVPYLI